MIIIKSKFWLNWLFFNSLIRGFDFTSVSSLLTTHRTDKSSRLKFRKCTKKHLPQRLFFDKVAGLKSATFLKKDSGIGAFLWILRNFKEQLFLQNTSGGYFRTDQDPLPLLLIKSLQVRVVCIWCLVHATRKCICRLVKLS